MAPTTDRSCQREYLPQVEIGKKENNNYIKCTLDGVCVKQQVKQLPEEFQEEAVLFLVQISKAMDRYEKR